MSREKGAEFEKNFTELDLHGLSLKEAEHAVEMFLFSLHKSGTGSGKIITGRGSGVLYNGIKKYLEGHALVRNILDPPDSTGAAFLVEIMI